MENTIFAPATPEGAGGIAIIRISGEKALDVLKSVFRPKNMIRPGVLLYGHIYDGDEFMDEAMAVYMPAPNTYTKEDVCEIHCHGSQAIVAMVMRLLSNCDCRVAKPGEFTRRAFENGRIDLAEAEAVMDIISSNSESAAQASAAQLSGSLSNRIFEITNILIDSIASLEAALDYPEDEWEQEASNAGIDGIKEALCRINALKETFGQGSMIREGIRCAIIGKPNAGKSTFMNAAAGFERAIVDDSPGTTRDTVEHVVNVGGNKISLIDTAGIREQAEGVEKRGIDLGIKRLNEADICLLIVDSTEKQNDMQYFKDIIGDKPCIVILNKMDRQESNEKIELDFADKLMKCSALNNEGVHEILHEVIEMTATAMEEDVLVTNARHFKALKDAADMLMRTTQSINEGVYADIALIDAKKALDTLGEITGETAGEDVIDAIFSKFCLGK